jgi:hypothetical protein
MVTSLAGVPEKLYDVCSISPTIYPDDESLIVLAPEI